MNEAEVFQTRGAREIFFYQLVAAIKNRVLLDLSSNHMKKRYFSSLFSSDTTEKPTFLW
jgi:hypothetical protein